MFLHHGRSLYFPSEILDHKRLAMGCSALLARHQVKLFVKHWRAHEGQQRAARSIQTNLSARGMGGAHPVTNDIYQLVCLGTCRGYIHMEYDSLVQATEFRCIGVTTMTSLTLPPGWDPVSSRDKVKECCRNKAGRRPTPRSLSTNLLSKSTKWVFSISSP